MKVRISLQTALGDNAVSVDFFGDFNFDSFICIWQQRVKCYVKETTSNQCFIFQYPWDDSEMYLFRATIAYALRQYYSQQNKAMSFTYVARFTSVVKLLP